MKMVILIGYTTSGMEKQVLVCEDEFKYAKKKAKDFFTSDIKNPHKAGEFECVGDTSFLSGPYKKED